MTRFTDAGAKCTREPLPSAPMLVLLTPVCFVDDSFVQEVSEALAASTTKLLPFYSTEVPFSVYIQRCQAELKALGLLSHMFSKWPAGEVLQHAAAIQAVQDLQPQDSKSSRGPLGLPSRLGTALRAWRAHWPRRRKIDDGSLLQLTSVLPRDGAQAAPGAAAASSAAGPSTVRFHYGKAVRSSSGGKQHAASPV